MKRVISFFPFFLFLLVISCGKITNGTCTDGKKNGNESGIDCGGAICDVCPTCNDSIQNQQETGIDCGGECSPCPTCTDGIKNQNETGIDCGGVCKVCPTCNDGIKNQNEEEIDCGGECAACSATRCNTPIGVGENGYVPNGSAALHTAIDSVNISSLYELEVNSSFPFGSQCNGYILSFYNRAFLNLPINKGMIFLTSDYSYNGDDVNSRCYVEVFMPQTHMVLKADQKIYVTKVNATTLNIKFCNLDVFNVYPYTLNTNFSANINFTF